MVLPLGMNIPLYMSSAMTACGVPPSTATGRHRRVSAVIAWMYGKFGRSSNVGIRSVPTTVSSSAWALGMKLSPNLAQAKKKLERVLADWTPSEY